MTPMAVIGISVGVGVVVYTLSLWYGTDEVLALGQAPDAVVGSRADRRRRERRTPAPGFEPGADRAASTSPLASASDGGDVYVPLAQAAPTPWNTRVAGVVGLLALVVAAAAVLALTLYEAGHLVNQTIAKFLEQ